MAQIIELNDLKRLEMACRKIPSYQFAKSILGRNPTAEEIYLIPKMVRERDEDFAKLYDSISPRARNALHNYTRIKPNFDNWVVVEFNGTEH